MRILLVHPGASISTSDVYDGLAGAFTRAGVDLFRYNLDGRIAMAGGYLKYMKRVFDQREKDRKAKGLPAGREFRYGSPDVIYMAGQDLLARALRTECDWVFVVSGMYLHPDWMIIMRRAGIKIAVLLTESPYDDVVQAPFVQHCDVAWTNERTSVQYLRQFNPNVHYLQHAIDPAKHNPYPLPEIMPEAEGHDVIFIGTAFIERQRLLAETNWDGIDLGLYGTYPYMGSRSKLRAHLKGSYVENKLAVELYRRSKIGLNIYRTSMGFGRDVQHILDAESVNPRALELAACGVFSISTYRKELHEMFGPNIPTFTDARDLSDMVRYYLSHENEREQLAASLPKILANHDMTFDARTRQVLGQLTSIASGREN